MPPKNPTDHDLPDPPLPGQPGQEPDPDTFPDPMPDPDPIPVRDPELPQPGEVVPPIHSGDEDGIPDDLVDDTIADDSGLAVAEWTTSDADAVEDTFETDDPADDLDNPDNSAPDVRGVSQSQDAL